LPWNADYSLDEASFRTNLARLCAARVHGIYTTGSTGEFYALAWPEFKRVVELVIEVVAPTGIPVQIGCCSDDTLDTLRQIGHAMQAGADGVQIVLPYWMELTDEEVLKFFGDIAAAHPGVPLIHYNIPRAKRFLTGEDYKRALDVAPSLIGVKFTFAAQHFGVLQEAMRLTPSLSYFVAESMLVPCMQFGVRGSYSSLVCTNPAFMQKIFGLAETRQWDEALQMQARVNEFSREFKKLLKDLGLGSIDPVGDKGLAVASGFLVGHQRTRPPYIGWDDAGLAKVRTWLTDHYPELLVTESVLRMPDRERSQGIRREKARVLKRSAGASPRRVHRTR
jgi:dihydrodipicolinate synthase/N-acetylneuraminate lyase